MPGMAPPPMSYASRVARPPQPPTSPWGVQTASQVQTTQRRGDSQTTTNEQTGPAQMPSMYHDPNSGNVFQWRPEMSSNNGGWSLFSQGGPGGVGAAGAAAAGRRQGADALNAYAQASQRIPQPVARITAPNRADGRAAEAAEFSRAKDRVGLATQGLLKSVGSIADARGIGGSSIEGDLIGSALSGGQGQIADLLRQQAITSLDRDYDVEDRDYAGDITQRGQDVTQAAQRQQAVMALMRMMQAGAY
jgi:hypothetical protein